MLMDETGVTIIYLVIISMPLNCHSSSMRDDVGSSSARLDMFVDGATIHRFPDRHAAHFRSSLRVIRISG
jgi:hypothetical protein